MSVPPPLPTPSATRRPGASFVTILAWVAIVAAALGVMYSVVQVVTGLFVPGYQMQMLNPGGAELPPLPPMVQWYFSNTVLLGVGSLLASLALLLVSRGLLHRREWARRGFIALLVLGTLWQLSWVWIMPQILEATFTMQMATLADGEELKDMAEFTGAMVRMLTIAMAVLVLAFAALHAWLVWKLCTPAVRGEFEARPA